MEGIVVRNTSRQSLNDVAIYQDDIEPLTVKSSVDEGHVDAEKLDDGLANEKREGPHKRLRNNSLPMAVCAIENSADFSDIALLWIHAFPDLVRLALEKDGCERCTGREISLW